MAALEQAQRLGADPAGAVEHAVRTVLAEPAVEQALQCCALALHAECPVRVDAVERRCELVVNASRRVSLSVTPHRVLVVAPERIVIVGGGLAAARVCQQLRVEGLHRELVLVGAETHLPYDRPPLSKDVLVGKRDESALRFDPDALALQLRLGIEATALDTANHTVQTTGGELDFDRLVLATGATPIRLPGDGEQLTLRTLDDSLRLRERLQPGLASSSSVRAGSAPKLRRRRCRVEVR